MAKSESPRAPSMHNSPRNDSPRRRIVDMHPLELELEQAMNKLRLQDVEKRKMHEQERKMHNEGIDRLDSILYQQTHVALEQAQRNRELLRREAEACLQRWIQEQEEEQFRRQELERLKREKEAQEKAARDLKLRQERERLEREKQEMLRREQEQQEHERQERQRVEAEAKQKAERQRQEEERRRQKQQQEEEEQERVERKYEQERVERENEQRKIAAEAKELERQQKANDRAKAVQDQASPDENKQILNEHAEYLELYERIKKWKNDYWTEVMEQARGNDPRKKYQYPEIKEKAGDFKRVMRGVNVLTQADKETNKKNITKIKDAIKEALSIKTPHIGRDLPVNLFLPTSLQLNDNNQATITDLGAWSLCCFVQSICKVFMESAPTQPENAEPVGTLLSSVFAMQELQFQRTSTSGTTDTQTLFPMVIAKYHKVCPTLFGITGDEKTLEGKKRIGWQMVKNEDGSKGTFAAENHHYDRQTGLAVGFSSFGLRNFAASAAMRNPYPPIHFWRSLALIVNLPPEQVQPTHLCVLKSMFGKDGIRRFLLFFGAVGMAAIREAYINFPERLPDRLKANTLWKELWVYARDKLREDADLTLEFNA